ncbi:uncharacterized protein ATC70_001635 [Mucor velutinosus]|uniref:Major facilitator superfamily (MFS) profile domain-containing protein n=1 Tax=Mucor velutinosus TaxID=708070 RepID=A0AAN7DJQ0_9FUNG|nr:hypothetical protein ATC70_001635 [Mucor velutinosus]
MTEHSEPVKSESTHNAQDDPMKEDLPDLQALIESMSIFSGSSSQIQTQVRVESLGNLVDLPLGQLKMAVTSIDMQSWVDDITVELLKEIGKADTLPSTNAAYLVYAATFAKMTALKSNVPRVLMNGIQQLAQQEGKCIMDGLLVPLLFQSELGKPQCEVINKSISELNPSQRVSMLQIILSDGESYFAANATAHFVLMDHRNYLRPWSDTVVQIMSTILSTQPLIELDKTLLYDLVQPLQTIVQSNPKDKGAMQLLLLLTSKYAQAIIEYQAIDLIEGICQSSTMFLKRAVLANAISDNLPAGLGFGISGVNTGTLVHSIVFTVGTLFTNPIVKRVGAHRWIPILMNSWAVVTWAHALIHNFSGFIAVRFFVALTEAGFIPASLTYLTGWYKTNELATRLAWFWGIQSFASAFSGLISFGIFRMAGIGGLHGWEGLFIIDGIFTHLVGIIAFPATTAGLLRGKNGWFTERERNIAVTRVIRDDKTKKEQYERITWHDVKISVTDTKLWVHLLVTFVGIMPHTPVSIYLPTLIKGYGFDVTTSNLLTVPSFFIGLIISIIIAKSADRFGNYALHALIGCVWSMIAFLVLQFLPNSAGRWSFYAAALFVASTPPWHGMQIAWMSSNLAPVGKRTIALGAVIGAANICGVPGSQIYQASDAPHFHVGNWVNFGLMATAALFFVFQRTSYSLTNKIREKKWSAMSDDEKKEYSKTTTSEGSNRIDFRFRL